MSFKENSDSIWWDAVIATLSLLRSVRVDGETVVLIFSNPNEAVTFTRILEVLGVKHVEKNGLKIVHEPGF